MIYVNSESLSLNSYKIPLCLINQNNDKISNGNPKMLLPSLRPFQSSPLRLSRPIDSDIKIPHDFLNLNPINLPRSALSWSLAASFAAAISYADRGTSAIAASSLLDELKWTEGDLGDVQGAFFLGYALTQVFGGVLGGIGGDGELDVSENCYDNEGFDGDLGEFPSSYPFLKEISLYSWSACACFSISMGFVFGRNDNWVCKIQIHYQAVICRPNQSHKTIHKQLQLEKVQIWTLSHQRKTNGELRK